MSPKLSFVLILVLAISLNPSSGSETFENRALRTEGSFSKGSISEGVVSGLATLGETLYKALTDGQRSRTIARTVEARKSKLHPLQIIVPFAKGFIMAGLTAAVAVIIKLFIVQSFFASKLALILGSYFLLEKMARNTAAEHSTVRKIIYHHQKPQYMFPPVRESISIPEPTYTVSHSTGDIEIESNGPFSSNRPSEPRHHPYSTYSESNELKSHPFSSFSEISDSKPHPEYASYSENAPPSFRYTESEPQYSNVEPSDLKSYAFPSHTNYPESNPNFSESSPDFSEAGPSFSEAGPSFAESSSIVDDSSITYEQIPSRQHSYSIRESEGMSEAGSDQYYYASPVNGSSPAKKAVPDLKHAPIHVIADESPASRPLGRRVFRRLPIVPHRTKY